MQRSAHGLFIAALLVFAVALAVPVAAFAALEDSVVTESSTNPSIGNAEATWRWSWGNSIQPDMTVRTVPSDGTFESRNQTLGFIYNVRQVDPSGIGAVTPTWQSCSLSPKPEGTWITSVFDIARVNDSYGWTTYPGAATRGEGMYAVTFLFYNQFRLEDSGSTDMRVRGLDFTNPQPVSGLSAPTTGLAVAGGTWTESRRRDLTWDQRSYDALSGVGGYLVAVNDSDTVFAHNTAPDSAYEPYASFLNPSGTQVPQLDHVTVEDLPAGRSTVSVTVVDRATNESGPRSVFAYIDYDTPTLAVLTPAAAAIVGVAPTFAVKASDGAGISKVSYYVDGILVGSPVSAPWTLKPSLSAFASGTHTLRVVAEDRIGSAPGAWHVAHTATKTLQFKLDKTALKLTNFSRTPAVFYPILRDGYYDNSTVRFTLNKAATAKLTVRNSAGRTIRTITASKRAGANSFVWDGKWASDKKAHTGTYTYQVTAVDASHFTASTSRLSTSIRNYQIIKTGVNSVRVVRR